VFSALGVLSTTLTPNSELRTPNYILRTTDFHGIDYADHRGVNRTLLAAEGHSRGAALHDQDNFVDSRSHGVHCDEMAFLVLAINANKSRDKQLAPVKAIVLPRGDYRSNYSSKNHEQ
jgi:hypothetical protein